MMSKLSLLHIIVMLFFFFRKGSFATVSNSPVNNFIHVLLLLCIFHMIIGTFMKVKHFACSLIIRS